MNPLILSTLLVLLGVISSSSGYASSSPPVRISYGSNMPSSAPSSSSSYSRQSAPSAYSHHTSSAYSQPASSSYSPPSSPSTSYYSSPSSSPTSFSPSSSPYGYQSPSSSEGNAAIVNFNRNIQPSNSDSTSFTTSNGISSSHNVQVVRGRPGSYQDEYGQNVQSDSSLSMNGHSYHQSPEGQHISLTWNADENGFSAQGDHLPKPVQMPAEHAEAHRQALLIASQSNSGGYRGSSNSPGYGSSSPSSSSYNNYGPPQPQAPPPMMSYPSYSAPPHQSAYRPAAAAPQQQNSHGYY